MVSLAPCDHKATSQVFTYYKKAKSVVINGTNECRGYDANKNFKPELCSSSSGSYNMVFNVLSGKFFIDKVVNLCLDNVAGETAGLPLSIKATKCDQRKRSQEFDILSATGARLRPLERYRETDGVFNIALMGSDTQCLSVSSAAVSCRDRLQSASRQFSYNTDKNHFSALGGAKKPVCVTAGESETKNCADDANQEFAYDYAKAMFRGPIDNVNLCFPEPKQNGPTLLRWCDNDKKLY